MRCLTSFKSKQIRSVIKLCSYSRTEQKTFCIILWLFPVLDEKNETEANDLHYSSDKGHLSGEELEPTDGVVVQDVNNVGEQDQSNSGTESFPGNTHMTTWHIGLNQS